MRNVIFLYHTQINTLPSIDQLYQQTTIISGGLLTCDSLEVVHMLSPPTPWGGSLTRIPSGQLGPESDPEGIPGHSLSVNG